MRVELPVRAVIENTIASQFHINLVLVMSSGWRTCLSDGHQDEQLPSPPDLSKATLIGHSSGSMAQGTCALVVAQLSCIMRLAERVAFEY